MCTGDVSDYMLTLLPYRLTITSEWILLAWSRYIPCLQTDLCP
jgi:hypothetical protein